MTKQIITKTCSHCKQIKPVLEFCKNRTKKDGYQTICKTCQMAYKRQYVQSEESKMRGKRYWQSKKGKAAKSRKDKKYAKNNPEKRKAKVAICHAITAGRIPLVSTLKCSCGKQAEQYHHPSYLPESRLNVVPKCRKCHRKLHSKKRPA